MSGSLEGRIRLRYVLLLVIIATLPAYCCGIVLLRLAPDPSRQPTATAFRLSTRTPTSGPTSVIRTPPPTLAGLTIIPSQTSTPTQTATATATATATGTATFTLSPTASQTFTVTPTFTLSPTVTPSLTPPPSLTSTPTYTPTPTFTTTATETRRPPDTATFTPETPSPTP